MLDFVAGHGAEPECGERLALRRPVDPATVTVDDREDPRVRRSSTGGAPTSGSFATVAQGLTDPRDEDHRLAKRRVRSGSVLRRSAASAPIAAVLSETSGSISPSVAGHRRRRGPPAAQQLPVQRFGGGFRRHIEIAAQRIAATPVLAQRVGVASLPRQGLHEIALRALVRRLDGDEAFERRDATGVIAHRLALRGHALRRGQQQAPQLTATLVQPLLERRRSGVETVQQHARVPFDGLSQALRENRRLSSARNCATSLVASRGVERDGPAVALQRRGAHAPAAPPQAGQRLAQARTREFRIRVLPKQAGQRSRECGTPGSSARQPSRACALREAMRISRPAAVRTRTPPSSSTCSSATPSPRPLLRPDGRFGNFHAFFTPVETPR